ncbi:MAG: 5'-methylthioadenosine/adenosylhomocysteine nucleosidase [Treponema sp.]|nr:5'-methylthioadenosine/adenosylhomocysteine nucleosidase [Treponema sp.]
MEKIGIIGAMESEVNELVRSLQYAEKTEYAGLVFNSGILNGKKVVVVKSGIGKVNAALCAQALILKFEVDAVINTGIAGALGSGLRIFDFVVSSAAVYHDFDTTAFGYKKGQVPGMTEQFTADESLEALAEKAFAATDFSKNYKIIRGLVASGDQFVSDKQQKKIIQESFNPACVEMEGCAIAHTCSLNKIPFVIVRCMSDMADETVEQTYSFNEDICAAASASLVKKMMELM